jgi:hypothetical protein
MRSFEPIHFLGITEHVEGNYPLQHIQSQEVVRFTKKKVVTILGGYTNYLHKTDIPFYYKEELAKGIFKLIFEKKYLMNKQYFP